jgi:uncharacterized protein YndB with AHSA1/START domain
MSDKVELDAFYPHAPDKVWRALTEPEALRRWMMPTDFRPRVGHKFRFEDPDDRGHSTPVRCEVVELDAPRRLAYTWQSADDPEPSLVRWTLEPEEAGTRVRLVHTGLQTPVTTLEASLNWRGALHSALPSELEAPRVVRLGRATVSRRIALVAAGYREER